MAYNTTQQEQDEYNARRTDGTATGAYTKQARRIFVICNRNSEIHNEVFAEWFLRAFPEHYVTENDSYVLEWVRRFERGCPFLYMDTERKAVYLFVAEHYTEIKHTYRTARCGDKTCSHYGEQMPMDWNKGIPQCIGADK